MDHEIDFTESKYYMREFNLRKDAEFWEELYRGLFYLESKNMINKLAKKAVSLLPAKLEEIGTEVLDEAKKMRTNLKLVDQVDLNSLAFNIREINKASGFGVDPPKTHQHMIQLMLIVTEVAEAAEAYRKCEGDDRIKEELADIIIRALDMAAYWGYDIDKAVKDKMEKNKSRPYRHGGRLV